MGKVFFDVGVSPDELTEIAGENRKPSRPEDS